MNNKVYLGYTTMTHGIKGELKFYSELYEFPEICSAKIPVLIEDQSYDLTSAKPHKNHYLITINNINDINLVEMFRNKKIYILRENIKLKNKTYLISELIGYKISEKEEELGKVTNIIYNKNGILLHISNQFYIPFLDNFIVSVEVESKTIKTKNVKGLIL